MTLGFTVKRPHGFSLQAAASFYSGFTPGSGMAAADASAGTLTLAFRLDNTFAAVAVALREDGDRIALECAGSDDEAAVRKQVSRMLGLDADGHAWLEVGQRDPVVGALQEENTGFFTAAKASPYDAAAWGIISPRMQMKQAAKLKIAMGEKHGDVVVFRGRSHSVFPSPTQLLAIDSFAGLSEEKMLRLKGIAAAALAGKLDADRLRALDEDDALAELQELPGVGPWTAGHILYRGAALVDALPTGEPRVLHGLAAAYGKKSVTVDEALAIGERWRPFRMWVCVLLARHLGRVGGWSNPSLRGERAEAGKRIAKKTKSRPTRRASAVSG